MVLRWYPGAARDLPWRRPDAGSWAILVSEVMLQQTPVARVLPAHEAWLARWPTATSLAGEPAGEAVRQWGRLGYPRRALRLHETARVLVERHQGEVPSDLTALLALPGVGVYTARAVAPFAFGQRHAVVDTNARRVLHRAVLGRANGRPAPLRDLRLATAQLPADPQQAATFAVALMELGALVCTARRPRCTDCPLSTGCEWRQRGYPADPVPSRRRPPYEGTDRQARGRLLSTVSIAPADIDALTPAWPEPGQRQRALAGLVTDGLLSLGSDGRYTLPP